MRKFKTQSEYINSFPLPVRVMLNEMRRVILEEAPSAEQSISYGMAAFKIKRPLVYIAGFKNHVSFFQPPPEWRLSDRSLQSTKHPKVLFSFRSERSFR